MGNRSCWHLSPDGQWLRNAVTGELQAVSALNGTVHMTKSQLAGFFGHVFLLCWSITPCMSGRNGINKFANGIHQLFQCAEFWRFTAQHSCMLRTQQWWIHWLPAVALHCMGTRNDAFPVLEQLGVEKVSHSVTLD